MNIYILLSFITCYSKQGFNNKLRDICASHIGM